MKLNGITFPRADVVKQEEIEYVQTKTVMGDGTVRVRNVGPSENLMTWRFSRLSDSDWGLLKAMVASWDGAIAEVTIIDDFSVSRTGHYWNGSLQAVRRLGRFWTVTLTFRINN